MTTHKHEQKERWYIDVLRSLKVLIFSLDGFRSIMKFSALHFAIVFFFVCVLFQSMPTSSEEIYIFANMYVFYALKFAICVAIIIGFYKIMGGKTNIRTFVASTSLTYTYAMIVSMIAAYSSLIVFEYWLKISVISGVVQSFIPYYTSVLFGWGCENVAGVENKWKAVAIGLFSITLLLTYILFIDPLLCQLGVMDIFGIAKVFCGG